MKIYVCGNPLVDVDALPLRILPALRKAYPKIQFIEFEPTEDLPHEAELVIIDTIINAKEVMMIDTIDAFVQTKALSLHDFDLGMNLKLAKKMGWLKKVTIIGVPPHMEEKECLRKIGGVVKQLKP